MSGLPGLPPPTPGQALAVCTTAKVLAWIGGSGAVLAFAMSVIQTTAQIYELTSSLAILTGVGALLVHFYCVPNPPTPPVQIAKAEVASQWQTR